VRLRAEGEDGGSVRGTLPPHLRMRFFVEVRQEGYLFVVNDDDTGAAQWLPARGCPRAGAGTREWLAAARVEPGSEFEVGLGTLVSRTAARSAEAAAGLVSPEVRYRVGAAGTAP